MLLSFPNTFCYKIGNFSACMKNKQVLGLAKCLIKFGKQIGSCLCTVTATFEGSNLSTLLPPPVTLLCLHQHAEVVLPQSCVHAAFTQLVALPSRTRALLVCPLPCTVSSFVTTLCAASAGVRQASALTSSVRCPLPG